MRVTKRSWNIYSCGVPCAVLFSTALRLTQNVPDHVQELRMPFRPVTPR